MNEQGMEELVISSGLQSYVYVLPSPGSSLVVSTNDATPPTLVFDDGFVTMVKERVIFTNRVELGVINWFSQREPIDVKLIGPPSRKLSGDLKSVTFTDKWKTIGFSVDLPRSYTFVGDCGVFVCLEVRGSVFSCLQELFRLHLESSKIFQYYEDSA